MYLCGAYELRHPGAAAGHNIRYMDNKDVMPYVSASLILDYLGINYDGEKAVNIEKEFIISIKDSGELYLVHLYKGTVFYTQTDGSRKDGLPVLNLSKTELYGLATKTYKEDSPALSKEAGEIIAILKEYVTDTSKYKGFNIIEPLCEEN